MKENIVYYNRVKSIHDERMTKALRERFYVTEVYKNSQFGSLSDSRYQEIALAGPLSDEWPVDFVNLRGTIGISWGYDINEEIKKSENLRNFKRNINNCVALIVDSTYSKRVLREKFRFSLPILKMPYGCDFDRFSSLSSPLGNNNLAVLRNWNSIYKNELIFKALGCLNPSSYGLVFVPGTGNSKSQFLSQTTNISYKLVSEFALEGPALIADILQKSDIYISASQSDGTSVTLLECMASGRIAITSDFPTNLEWIEDGINGFTFKNGDWKSLAQVLKKVLDLPTIKRKEIGINARETVKRSGNWEMNKIILQDFIGEFY